MSPDSSVDSASVTAPSVRARELRSILTTQLDAEALLARAAETRRAAVADADAILAEAQQVSHQLLEQGRRDAEALVDQARTDADRVRARAETEVEGHRRQVREQSSRMIGDLEASVRTLGSALESTQSQVAQVLTALDELRARSLESSGAGLEPTGAQDEGRSADPPAPAAPADPADHPEVGAGPPRTALEAYLRSAHLDFDDPPLDVVDDAEVAQRYARDAGLGEPATAGAEDSDPAVEPAVAPADAPTDSVETRPATDKPLGWLFRNTP